MSIEPSGLERVFFPVETRAEIDGWVESMVRRQLDRRVKGLLFRSGRIDSVYGVQLVDGDSVVLRLYRPPVDIDVLAARLEALRVLAGAGYPCPLPLSGPFDVDGRLGAIETLLTEGVDEDARRPDLRRALASSLLEHIDLLRDRPDLARRLVTGQHGRSTAADPGHARMTPSSISPTHRAVGSGSMKWLSRPRSRSRP
jgi:hypothetical protein